MKTKDNSIAVMLISFVGTVVACIMHLFTPYLVCSVMFLVAYWFWRKTYKLKI